ncbi:MAG TPA: hypothetical protein VKU00_21140 [Chthonomonadaceae bacterium]|nr:hypothetical protein [Chthonomonadaceae bacterium]
MTDHHLEKEGPKNTKRRTHFTLKELEIVLTRLDDDAYYKIARRSLAIQEDGFFLLNLFRPQGQERGRMNFAETYLILKYLYGESGQCYDDYKGSFAFPFALDVIKRERSFHYLLRVHNFRSMLEFALRRRVDSTAQIDPILHAPFEDEFSRQEINEFIAFFYGYLEGRMEILLTNGIQPPPFLHRVQSNLILYGCLEGRFFEEHFDNQEEFEQAYSCRLDGLG